MNERCAGVRERLSAYLDGELDAAAAAGVEEHLAGCDDCAAVLADYAAAGDALAGAVPVRPESEWEALASRVDAAIEREVADVARANAVAAGAAGAAEQATPSWWHRRRFALGSAATLVAALLIAVLQPWWSKETPHTVPARVPVDTLGEPAPVLSPAPGDELAAESAERSKEDMRSSVESATPGHAFAGKAKGTLGETLRSDDTVARPPASPVKRETPAAPLPEPSRSRQDDAGPSAAGGKSLYRMESSTTSGLPPGTSKVRIRSEREWESDLAEATRNALGTDDPQPSLSIAREWDRFLASYPERNDVLDDRAAAWTRAARLGAPGACDEAPSRIDEWIANAAGDAERAAAQALRDELAADCP